ncbi:MAG: phage minor head protein [Sulfuricella sp.]
MLAGQVGNIINGFTPGDPEVLPTLSDMLRRYAEALTPWASATAAKMLEEVNRKDYASWKAAANEMSSEVRRELSETQIGEVFRRLQAEQVELIKSIPIDAAQRVHDLTIKGLEDSTRAKEVAAEIMRSGDVAKSRAMLIARTEVSRASSNFTQARSEAIGSEGYIWRTSSDGDVRHSHKAMNGKYVRWDSPPTLDKMTGHAGTLPNCRCYPEPIIPD